MATKILNGLDPQSQKFDNVAAPSGVTNAAMKQYADNAIKSIKWKNAVTAATNTNLTLCGGQTIDRIATSASRVLVKNQATASTNGIYVTGTDAATRATDFDESTEVTNDAALSVEGGTVNGETIWQRTTASAITVGTTARAGRTSPLRRPTPQSPASR